MTFLFIILVGILLIAINFNAIKKERNSFNSILEDKVDNMEEFELRIGELKREIAETKFDFQKEIQEIKDIYYINQSQNRTVHSIEVDSVETQEKVIDKKNKVNKRNSSNVYENSNDNNSNSIKIREIGNLLKQGIDIDEIAEKLNIGKGEVLLIQELYLK